MNEVTPEVKRLNIYFERDKGGMYWVDNGVTVSVYTPSGLTDMAFEISKLDENTIVFVRPRLGLIPTTI